MIAAPEHVDVLVVGAGISGISAGWHLQRHCPDRSYLILEAREAIGGTWDLFRYPGVRSDSDMHTLGFAFQPWTGEAAIADGAAILRYVQDTASAHGIDRHIRFGTRVVSADWSEREARWTVAVIGPAGHAVLTCGFIDLCSGYYDYAAGHAPVFAGSEDFGGPIVHPQFWPEKLDLGGKRVAVIGSGATAVTLVPALAQVAASVTMVQRSPSYVVAQPARDRIAAGLRRALGARLAYRLVRAKNVTLSMAFFQASRRWPERVARRMIGMAQAALGPDYDTERHFTPRYKPWDQRVCLTPDGDFFAAIGEGRAAVVTGAIERFEPGGVRMASGEWVPADVVVTATGLAVKMAGGIAFSLDGAPIDFAGRLQYRGMMFDGVPNLAFTFGYTNASWTLKADLTARYLCRLLNAMQRRAVRIATPVNEDPAMTREAFLPFSSGYIARVADQLPVQGARKPWRLHQNYLLDVLALRFGALRKNMRFDR
ncbi:NAD(P)/FAD-dependent oxidoreductase [Sphingomonas sp. KR1UV-12]|uniref:NAD(P)/FAD-dependent oxidoreductase n=1 Tax=Sphingomonas aurea TaxID=3063994 RepID=A0ABT9EG08_9SPHN|nr:NAD(P)/FAD-dependent oxidoreductase [Sphingomonas sp. KR1UV-12]MDP1025899.1 NAD(P)/FAD-dependent oxidoreductase [Sphingomonas sp. KR1UV-12]